MKHFISILADSVLIILLFSQTAYSAQQNFASLLNSPAEQWDVDEWWNSEKLELKDLKGEVVLVRWWTAPGCPFCQNSASALNEFYETYHDKGLEVIGFYHHKSRESLDKNKIKQYADTFGFQFPLAIDYQWKTLRKWWLDNDQRQWTSVTFLIDKDGLIRHIHPGGEYLKGDEDYIQLKSMIEKLLAERQI